jgi:hypothetical protein
MSNDVCLLGTFAETARETADSGTQAGNGGPTLSHTSRFWNWVTTSMTIPAERVQARAPTPPPVDFADLSARGFGPFARIRTVRLHVLPSQRVQEIVFEENGAFWDLSEWGEKTHFKSRVLAECYFLVTRDDFQIDAAEAEVLRALTTFLQPAHFEAAMAREIVYWSLVDHVLEDNVLSEEEEGILERIAIALSLTRHEQNTLHLKAIREKLEGLATRTEGQTITMAEIDAVLAMAERLRVPEAGYDTLLQKVQARIE